MGDFSLSELLSAAHFEDAIAPWVLEAGAKALRFLVILIVAAITSRLLGGALERVVRVLFTGEEETPGSVAATEREKRTATLANVSRRTAGILVWSAASVMALAEVGFDIGPLLAGAGVAGLAIGFGAQNLVRDFFGGFFILLENQIRVGDVAVINGQGGLVEQINLRTTVLRDLEGTVHVFPNGGITTLANRTRDFSCYVFDVGVAYKEDSDRVVELIRETVESMREDDEFAPRILAEAEIFGLDRFAESAIVVKGRVRVLPGQQWAIGREFNRRLKRRFDEEGVEIPFPHRKLIMERSEDPAPPEAD